MRFSSLLTSARLVLAGPLIVGLVACEESPTETALDPRDFAVAFDHRGTPHGPSVEITVEEQPTIAVNPIDPETCRIPYSFRIHGKGKEREVEVEWRQIMLKGEGELHYGGAKRTVPLGTKSEGLVISPTLSHPNDDSSFEAIRISVLSLGNVLLAETLTEGATVSC